MLCYAIQYYTILYEDVQSGPVPHEPPGQLIPGRGRLGCGRKGYYIHYTMSGRGRLLYIRYYIYIYILYYTILYYTWARTATIYIYIYICIYIYMYYNILYYTILYYTILYYTILYYTILYYTMLYYTILYYIYCTIPGRGRLGCGSPRSY